MTKGPRSWLGGLLVAAAFVASVPPAWSGDIRVGFINPGMTGEAFWLLVSATMQAAATEFGIDLDIRYTNREHEKTIAVADQILSQHPLPNYLVATNDIGVGVAIIKRAEAAGVPIILLPNDLDQSQWAEFGEPRLTGAR